RKSLAPVAGAGKAGALAHRLVEQGRRRGGDVQRTHVAAHGEAEQPVADAPGQGAEALLLAAEAEDDLAGEIDLPGGFARGVGAVDPEALLLEALQGGGGVDDALDGEPLARPRRGLGDGRGEGRRAAVADHCPADAGPLADPE